MFSCHFPVVKLTYYMLFEMLLTKWQPVWRQAQLTFYQIWHRNGFEPFVDFLSWGLLVNYSSINNNKRFSMNLFSWFLNYLQCHLLMYKSIQKKKESCINIFVLVSIASFSFYGQTFWFKYRNYLLQVQREGCKFCGEIWTWAYYCARGFDDQRCAAMWQLGSFGKGKGYTPGNWFSYNFGAHWEELCHYGSKTSW